jgi:hypothetical protein
MLETGTTVFATYSDDKVAGVTTSGKSIGVTSNQSSSLMDSLLAMAQMIQQKHLTRR